MFFDNKLSNIFIAALLNFNIPGLGLIYRGSNQLIGVWMMVAATIFGLIWLYPHSSILDQAISNIGFNILILFSNMSVITEALEEEL